MSGHSKWANIKRKKEANDKVKGAVFAKLSHIITIAVMEGGGIGDPEHNFKLRLAVDKARSLNMPKDNIQRAIDKAMGSGKNQLKEIIYEGFAPHGVSLMIQTTSDNQNRTVSEVKNRLEQRGGKLGSQGSVSYMFQKCVSVTFDKAISSEEAVFKFAGDLEATDIDEDEASYTVYVPFTSFGKIKDHLAGVSPTATEIEYKPTTLVSAPDEKAVREILALAEAVEELDDVQRVFLTLTYLNRLLDNE